MKFAITLIWHSYKSGHICGTGGRVDFARWKFKPKSAKAHMFIFIRLQISSSPFSNLVWFKSDSEIRSTLIFIISDLLNSSCIKSDWKIGSNLIRRFELNLNQIQAEDFQVPSQVPVQVRFYQIWFESKNLKLTNLKLYLYLNMLERFYLETEKLEVAKLETWTFLPSTWKSWSWKTLKNLNFYPHTRLDDCSALLSCGCHSHLNKFDVFTPHSRLIESEGKNLNKWVQRLAMPRTWRNYKSTPTSPNTWTD